MIRSEDTKKAESAAIDAFGLWAKRKVDGLVYQEEIRAEWRTRSAVAGLERASPEAQSRGREK